MKTGRTSVISVSGKKYDEEELKNAFSEAEKEVETSMFSEKIKVWMK